MGTSSGRRAPTTALWRLAKGAATRYLSPESGGTAAAREVAARYIAALEEGGGPGLAGALAAFRLTRRAAQNLGAFWSQVDSQDWPAARNSWGLTGLTGEEPEGLAQSLAVVLGVPGGGLEEAVVHTAMGRVLLQLPWDVSGGAPARPGFSPETARLVGQFLAEAFSLRLSLDLGESLETAAAGFFPLRQGLREIAVCIRLAVEAAGPPAARPRTPEDWLGLPGWTWVTSSLTGLMAQLRDHGPAPDSLVKI